MRGTSIPRGSNTELTVDRIPLLVRGWSLSWTLNWRGSDSTHHWTPRARSIGRVSFVISRFWRSFERSSFGMTSITDLWLDMNLWRLKPPFSHNFFLSFTKLMAASGVATDFNQQRSVFCEIIIILLSWQATNQQTYLAITTRLLNGNIPLSRP